MDDMDDMDEITAEILKAINDLKKSGIIEEIVSLSNAGRQGATDCFPLPEKAGTPEDGDTSGT